MKQIGLQIFTVRDYFKFPDMAKATFRRMAEIGYTQGQTAGFYCLTPEEYAAAAKDAGIEIVGTHYDWNKIIDETDDTMRIHEVLGTTNIGIGGMPGFARETKEGLLQFIEQANEVAAKINKHGFKFTYHNHSFEFKKFDGKTMFDYLVEGLDPKTCSFVLDTYWVQHGGGDPIKWINDLKGRIDILHLKDKKVTNWDGEIGEIGVGNLPWKKILDTAERTGVKTIVVEQDCNWTDDDAFKSAKMSADYLAQFLDK